MKKTGRLLVALAAIAIAAGTATSGAEAQMRTGKGEYYQGIKRAPYGSYLWLWPPEWRREPAYQQRPQNRPTSGKSDSRRKSYAQ
ncbi:hypothetical protein AC244_06675 [Ensifer adhaerens]|uniref:Uncharacterized protein n=1 Tax=Ensifer adhaerens TaxID=106592 RepID=A0A0L8C2M4_ENSAD|nr:hypothetical protein [Ensifer adhaerens]KOF21063.1 hypothetical protein AC244_06675 [Ensifer adhaerens]